MKPIRIALILGVALTIGLVDATVVRPIDRKFLEKKEKKPAPVTSQTKHTQNDGTSPSIDAPTPEHAEPEGMTAAELNELVQSAEAVIIDARLPDEFAAGHIPFALNINFQSFAGGKPAALDAYPTSQPFVIYCGGGDCDASEKVEMMMGSLGFTDIRIYHTGWPGWVEFGGEVEMGGAE